MRKVIAVASAGALSLTVVAGVGFAEFTKGTVKKIDANAEKVSIAHGELKNLDMPAMTMVFRIGEGVDASKLKEGDDLAPVVLPCCIM